MTMNSLDSMIFVVESGLGFTPGRESHMHRCLFAWLLLSLLAAPAAAQSGTVSQLGSEPGVRLGGRSFSDLYAAQRVLLSNFCRLDFEGARLEPGGWERFQPYTSLRANPDFTRVLVVTRYDIEAPAQPAEELFVHYQTAGSYRLGEGYTAGPVSEQAKFQVQEQNGQLLVTAITPESPHVSPRAALAWIKLLLADPKTSPLERAHLLGAVQQLNALLPAPHPAQAE
jgi:hypothetical protein